MLRKQKHSRSDEFILCTWVLWHLSFLLFFSFAFFQFILLFFKKNYLGNAVSCCILFLSVSFHCPHCSHSTHSSNNSFNFQIAVQDENVADFEKYCTTCPFKRWQHLCSLFFSHHFILFSMFVVIAIIIQCQRC